MPPTISTMAPNSESKCSSRPPSSPPVSLLLVEDEELALEFMALILGKKFSNITLHTATNGVTGLDMFNTHTPDIVVTDINMPDMDGVRMIREIRSIKPATRFIVLSGDSEKQALWNSDLKGTAINYYILKPVSFDELFTAIEKCFAEIHDKSPPA